MVDEADRRLWRAAMARLDEVRAWLGEILPGRLGRAVEVSEVRPAHADLRRMAGRYLDTDVVHVAHVDGEPALLPMILARRAPGPVLADGVMLFATVAEAWHAGRGEAMPRVVPLVVCVDPQPDLDPPVVGFCPDGDDDEDWPAEPTDETIH